MSAARIRIALAGDVALELMASYFREAGYEVYVPPGFGTWRQELLDPRSGLHAFKPDFVYDVTAADEPLSREVPNFYDERMRHLASMPYSLDGIRAIVDEAAFARIAAPKKVLAVDADNTLWRGIISEDGMDAVEPYRDFQEGLLHLRSAGVQLVLLSKNDPFEFRRDMPLANGDFAAVCTNWGPKAGNLIEACRTLNLGVDSVVFVDDNPVEREQMTSHLPEVAVVPFPSDMANPRQFLRRLKSHFFSDMGRTAEDALRSRDYAAEALRRKSAAQAATLDDYLDGLDLRVRPSLAQEGDLDRLAQMAGKTNQFNATTIRRTREDFAALLADPTKRIFVFRTRDRFGEQGIVCYAVVDLALRRVTDFVMSCRAMGRTLEHFAYGYVSRQIGYAPAVDFVRTAKNRPCEEFLANLRPEMRTHYREEA